MQPTNSDSTSSTPIWTQEHAIAIDSLCADLLPSTVLMEHAALAIRDAVREVLANNHYQLVIIAGKGNNGGDALAAARLLIEYQPDILLTHAVPTSSLAIAQLYAVQKLGLNPELYEPSVSWLQRKYRGKQLLIIDGIVGPGLTGKLTALLQTLIVEIQQYPSKMVIAIDIPSGLRCDQANAVDAIKADRTITFGGKKPAHVLPPAQDYCGDVRVAQIFPQTAITKTFANLPAPLYLGSDHCGTTPLLASAHKYQRGHVLVIGGSTGKCGAPLLAGLAALRAGAGLVSVAMPTATGYSLPLDLLYEDFFATGSIDLASLNEYVEQRQVRAIVIGCGCITSPIAAQLWKYLVQFARQGGSVVIDAGALHNLFALGEGMANIILTPHGGEWLTLADNLPTPNSISNITAIKNTVIKQGVTLIYKNSSPLVFSPCRQTPVYVCAGGDNALAKAGTGDIYAGIVAALTLVTGSWQAAVSAHAYLRRAANQASASVGRHGITASLLLKHLRGD